MKPNTNIDGYRLVIPDVDFCPLCGVMWVLHWKPDNSRRIQEHSVRPESGSLYSELDEPIYSALVWVCARCGFRHKHTEQEAK